MNREEKAKAIKSLQRECNSPKSALLTIARRLDEISPAKADQLRRIVARLEDWQNK